MLLSNLISIAKREIATLMVACICGVNVPSVALHESLGFLPVGAAAGGAGNKFEWLRLLIMQRSL